MGVLNWLVWYLQHVKVEALSWGTLFDGINKMINKEILKSATWFWWRNQPKHWEWCPSFLCSCPQARILKTYKHTFPTAKEYWTSSTGAQKKHAQFCMSLRYILFARRDSYLVLRRIIPGLRAISLRYFLAWRDILLYPMSYVESYHVRELWWPHSLSFL